MAEETFEQELTTVITSLCDRAKEERQKEKPWQDLFAASEEGLMSVLSEAHRQMKRTILDSAFLIEKKFNIKISNRLFYLLQALPCAMHDLRENLTKEEGISCCADKTRRIYYEEVLAEINRIKEETK